MPLSSTPVVIAATPVVTNEVGKPVAALPVFVVDENGNQAQGFANRNYALNPHFDEWFMGAGPFAFSGGNMSGWTAEGWVADGDNSGGSAGVLAVSRQAFGAGQTEVPGGPSYFLRFDQTTGATNQPNLEQRIGEVRELAGKTICVSIWLRCSSGTLVLQPRMQQVFGVSGGARVDVSPNEAVPNWTITTTWTRYYATFNLPSVAGKTFGTPQTGNGPSLDFSLFGPSGTIFRYDAAQYKLEVGNAPTSLLTEDKTAVRNRCRELHERISNGGALGLTFADGQMITATAFRGTLHYLPKNPGYTPVIAFSALTTWDVNSAAVTTSAPSALSAADPKDSGIARISATVAAYTAGQGASLRSPPSGTPDTWIDIDARY